MKNVISFSGPLRLALAATLACAALVWSGDPAAAGEAGVPLRISTEELEARLDDPNLRLIDVRPFPNFRRGSLPKAVSMPLDSLVDQDSRVRGRRLPDVQLARKFALAGIGTDSYVVVYDNAGGHKAARVLWNLHHFGHFRVSVLDGGFPKWNAEGRITTKHITRADREMFPIDLVSHIVATADYVLEHLDDPNTVIVDVRPPKMFNKAHIPGAVNVPWKASLTPDDTWKPQDDLRAAFEAAGITRDKNIILYCQFGNMNQHTYLTLKDLGYPRVRSYDLAWAGWSRDPFLPKVDADGNPVEAAAPAATD